MRHALRQLVMNPGFMVVALVTLALGIGVNTTAFSVLNRLMLQSLPFHDPGSLVQVWSHTTRDGNVLVPPADYFDLLTQNAVFTDMAAYSPWNTTSYAEPGKAPIQVGAIYMTANFFPILGVQPQLGRTPTEEESKKMAFVTLISDSFLATALRRESERTRSNHSLKQPRKHDHRGDASIFGRSRALQWPACDLLFGPRDS